MSTSRPSDPDAAVLADMVQVPAERDMPPGRQQAFSEYLMSEIGKSAGLPAGTPRGPGGRGQRVPRAAAAAGWPSRRALTTGVVATAGVAAVAVALISVFGSRSPTGSSPQAACGAPFGNGRVPFPGGYRASLAQARSAVGFPIPVPDSTAAGRHTLSGIWVSQDAELAALVYDKGKITIKLERWPTTANPITQDPGSWFRYERQLMGTNSAAIGQVNGGPALIVQPRVDSCRANPALVEFYRRGLEIDVSSGGYGTAELLNIARSMR